MTPGDPLPRLLVLSQTVPATGSGGGVVLYRMLRDYPPDRLLVVGPESAAAGDRLPCRYEWVGRARDRAYRTRFHGWLHAADAVGLLPHRAGPVAARLGGFRPQVVLSVMEGYLYRTAQAFARRHRLPLALVVHDRPDLLAGVPRWAAGWQRRAAGSAYRAAAARLCVSPAMEAHCRRAYGAGGEVLYPARSAAVTPRPPAESAALREPGVLRVGFAGSLGLGYGPQLRAMLGAFRAAGAKLYLHGRPGSGSADLSAAGPDVVVDRGFAPTPEQAWDQVKRDCDAVILPYYAGPDAGLAELYATHFPSKLTEYAALGLPVVVFGPAAAAGVRWAAERPGTAVVVMTDAAVGTDASDESEKPGLDPLDRLRDELLDLREQPNRRVRLAAGAVAAGAMFDPAAITHQFLSVLTRIAATGPNVP